MNNRNDYLVSDSNLLDKISFTDLFDIQHMQHLQDLFAETTGVASIITEVDGTPITKPSNFCRLCNDIIRKTEKGQQNCFKSDALIGSKKSDGPTVQQCLSGGLWDAGVSIIVGDTHVANWLIGQIRNEEIQESKIAEYALEIGADKAEMIKAFNEVPAMSFDRFQKVADMLFAYAQELSEKAYRNLELKQQISAKEKADLALSESEDTFKKLFEISTDPISILTDDGFIDCNTALIKLLKYKSKDDIYLKKPWELSPKLQPDGIDSELKAQNMVNKALIEGYNRFDWVHLTSDGKEILVEVMLTPIIIKGKQSFYVIWRDLTDFKQTANDLLNAHQKLDFHFDKTPLGVIEWDLDFKVNKWNPSAELIFGYSEAEAKNQHASFIVPIEIRPLINEIFTELILLKGGTRSSNQNIKKDGSLLYCDWFNAPLTDYSGKVIGVASLILDITEQKRTELELITNNANMTALIENTTDSIWTINKNYELVFLNSVFQNEFYQSFGIKLIPGMILVDALPEPLRPFWKERYDRVFNNERFIITDEVPLPNGSIFIEVSFNPIIVDNIVVGASFFGRDITQRKRSEVFIKEMNQKFITLFDSMTEMVVLHEVVFDDAGIPINYRILDSNKAFTEVTGIKAEDAKGKLATEIYQIETAPYLEIYSNVAISGEPYKYDTYFPPMDKHFAISVVSPNKNQFATVTSDITAVKQIQELIASKNKELENYLYVASHDLRSPLVNIQGFSIRLNKKIDAIKQFFEKYEIDEEHKVDLAKIIEEDIPKTLDFIFTNVAKMDNLINGLLQISRTGRIVMNIKQIDMNNLINSVVDSKKFQIAEANAQIDISQLYDCYGDENLLNQLFSNLIGNAINYRSSERNLKIEISNKVLYNKVIYKIKDNGIGIDNRHIEKIWDVFYRVDPLGTEPGEGLGLSIVKRIADKHKGKIWVESVLGVGTEFLVELNRNEFSE